MMKYYAELIQYFQALFYFSLILYRESFENKVPINQDLLKSLKPNGLINSCFNNFLFFILHISPNFAVYCAVFLRKIYQFY